MLIEILYFDGCPNYFPAVRLVEEAIKSEGIDAEVVKVRVCSDEQAHDLRFTGSPTIRVNGCDIDTTIDKQSNYGMFCRVYDGTGLPTREMLAEALKGAGTMLFKPGSQTYRFESDFPEVNDNATKVNPGMWAVIGSLLMAIVASACCWLPLVLIGTGISIGGIGGWVEQYRPVSITASVTMLAIGFFVLYSRKRSCQKGTECYAQSTTMRRHGRAMLWVVTALVIASATFPNYAGLLFGGDPVHVSQVTSVNDDVVELRVEGLTCGACATFLEDQLQNIAGVKQAIVHYVEGTATVVIDPDTPPDTDTLIAAIQDAGYGGSLSCSTPYIQDYIAGSTRSGKTFILRS